MAVEGVEAVTLNVEADRKKAERLIKDASDELVQIEGHRSAIKQIVETLHSLGIPKKRANSLIRRYHNRDMAQVEAEASETADLFGQIFPSLVQDQNDNGDEPD